MSPCLSPLLPALLFLINVERPSHGLFDLSPDRCQSPSINALQALISADLMDDLLGV